MTSFWERCLIFYMKKHVKSILLIFLGAFFAAFALNFFLLPHHIAPGGVTSLADMLSSAIPLSVGTWYALINIPLFIMGLRIIGREFFIKSLIGMAANALLIDLLGKIDPSILGLGDDLIISAIFGGFFIGLGYGLVLRAGGSSGGTDIVGWLIKYKKPTMQLGRAILICDLVIIILQSIVYGNIKLSLYAVIAMFISSRMVDVLNEGGTATKFTYIITEESDAISKRIMKETGRGVTKLDGIGMFTNEARTVLLCTMYRHDMPQIKRIIRDIDPEAFVVISDAREVSGEGFNPLKV